VEPDRDGEHPPIEVKRCGGGSVDVKARPWDGAGLPYFLHCSVPQWDELVARIKAGDLDHIGGAR
jgi:hypothetical protein